MKGNSVDLYLGFDSILLSNSLRGNPEPAVTYTGAAWYRPFGHTFSGSTNIGLSWLTITRSGRALCRVGIDKGVLRSRLKSPLSS